MKLSTSSLDLVENKGIALNWIRQTYRKWNRMNRRNKRRHERLPSSAPVALRWRKDSGEAHFGPGTVVDYSETGLRIELLEPIELRSYVVVGPPGQNKEACAGRVCYCLPKQTRYVIGLELAASAQRPALDPAGLEVSKVLQNREFSLLRFRP